MPGSWLDQRRIHRRQQRTLEEAQDGAVVGGRPQQGAAQVLHGAGHGGDDQVLGWAGGVGCGGGVGVGVGSSTGGGQWLRQGSSCPGRALLPQQQLASAASVGAKGQVKRLPAGSAVPRRERRQAAPCWGRSRGSRPACPWCPRACTPGDCGGGGPGGRQACTLARAQAERGVAWPPALPRTDQALLKIHCNPLRSSAAGASHSRGLVCVVVWRVACVADVVRVHPAPVGQQDGGAQHRGQPAGPLVVRLELRHAGGEGATHERKRPHWPM